MAAAATAISPPSSSLNRSSPSRNPNLPSISPLSSLKLVNPSFSLLKSLKLDRKSRFSTAAAASVGDATNSFHGLCYVVGDNIDTDQIIPAEYLTLVPSNPEEYEKLGSYALIGLPSSYETRFIESGATKTKYTIVIGGDNFGCDSSREHAPVALGAAGVTAVVAESYARIFFRNSVTTGEIYPLNRRGDCVRSVALGML